MDPEICWITMHDTHAAPAERVEAAENLYGWLNRGGFPPDGVDADTATRHALAVLAAFPA